MVLICSSYRKLSSHILTLNFYSLFQEIRNFRKTHIKSQKVTSMFLAIFKRLRQAEASTGTCLCWLSRLRLRHQQTWTEPDSHNRHISLTADCDRQRPAQYRPLKYYFYINIYYINVFSS